MTTLDDIGGWPALLGPLMLGADLERSQAAAGMSAILHGEASAAQIAAFAVALRQKGETVDELSGLIDAVLAATDRVYLAPPFDQTALDIVGTGGDRSHSINVSTTSMFVLAGGGVAVCKHGNRAMSSACGAGDLLQELGVNLELSAAQVAECVRVAGLGFCLATRFHPGFRHAGPVRRELGVPTSFNILGPMANPARVRRLVIGVADPMVAERMLGVMAVQGAERVLVVHGGDGLDEITTTGPTRTWELIDGSVRQGTVEPTELGLALARPDQLTGGVPALNARLTRAVLAGEHGPHRDIVVLNAAAGFYVAGRVERIADGLEMARSAIDSGGAAAALDRLIEASNSSV